MTSELKKTPNRRRAVIIQMVGGYVNKGIIIIQGLLLIPLYLHFIGVRMYGLWLASGGILAWLAFMDMGMGSLLIQRVSSAYGRREYNQTASYFVNGLVVYGVLDLLFLSLVLGLSFFIADWFGAEGEEAFVLRSCFQLAGIAAAAQFLNNCLRGFAQSLQRPLFPILCIISFRILGLGATVLLLYQDYRLWAIPTGLLINAIPVFVLNICYSLRLTRELGGVSKIDKTIILNFFQLSPALLASRVGQSMVKNIEPTLIAIILTPELAPAFVITKRAADMVEQLVQVIDGSTFPSFAHLYAEGGIKKSQRAISRIMTLCFGAGLIGFGTYVAANQAFVQLWVGSEYFLGQAVTLLMALGLLTMVINQFLSRFIIGTGDITYPSLLIFGEAVVRVILMAGLLYGLGLVGLPLGMLMSCMIFGWIYYKRLEAKLPLSFFQKWNWLRPSILLVAIFCIGFFVAQQVPVLETWFKLGGYLFLVGATLSFFSLLLNPALRSMFAAFNIPLFKTIR
jgi:O-antigen/teichoic acid export membrane protein